MEYFRPAHPDQALRAVPGEGQEVEVWILGSSTFGAQLAAYLGLPYAFASHFAPQMMMQAIRVYRETFRPSERLAKPHVMIGMNVFAAPTEEEARFLFTSLQQAFVNLRTGRPGKLPAPVEGYEARLDSRARMILDNALSCSVVGTPDSVRHGIADLVARTGADEVMVTAQIHDPAARLRSFALVAEAHADDGLVEAFRWHEPGIFAWGFQFHPEWGWRTHAAYNRIMTAYVDAVQQRFSERTGAPAPVPRNPHPLPTA